MIHPPVCKTKERRTPCVRPALSVIACLTMSTAYAQGPKITVSSLTCVAISPPNSVAYFPEAYEFIISGVVSGPIGSVYQASVGASGTTVNLFDFGFHSICTAWTDCVNTTGNSTSWTVTDVQLFEGFKTFGNPDGVIVVGADALVVNGGDIQNEFASFSLEGTCP